MNGKNDISEELRSLSALVATISRETPYRAPEGYFLNFPTAALERVQTSPIKTASEIPRVAGLAEAKPLTFTVPEGYFEGFAQQVLNRIKNASDDTKIQTGTSEEEVLPAILIQAGRKTPYSVPDGYFEGLSPILAVVKDKNPYLVPEGYFETLADKLSSKMLERSHPKSDAKAKVIGIGRRMSWMKYAAAAVVAGLIVTVGWLRWHPAPSSTQDLATTKPVSPVEIANNLAKVSDAELQNFLVDQDTTLAQPVGNMGLMATVDMDDNNLKTLLGGVTEGELKQYIDEQGGISDIAKN